MLILKYDCEHDLFAMLIGSGVRLTRTIQKQAKVRFLFVCHLLIELNKHYLQHFTSAGLVKRQNAHHQQTNYNIALIISLLHNIHQETISNKRCSTTCLPSLPCPLSNINFIALLKLDAADVRCSICRIIIVRLSYTSKEQTHTHTHTHTKRTNSKFIALFTVPVPC